MPEPPKDYNLQQYEKAFNEFAEAHEALRKKYRKSYKLTKKDLKDWPNAKVGDLISQNPDIPDTPKEAFELFANYYAQVQFELQKCLFIEKYKVWNKVSIKSEIDEIEKWITNAKALSYKDALEGTYKHLAEYEYLRLANGYYEGYKMTWHELQDNSTASSIYGQYFLFYNYLKEKLTARDKEDSMVYRSMKRDPLSLDYHIGYWGKGGLTEDEKKVIGITDIRKRLQYYNEHVKSLTDHATVAQMYIDDVDQSYKVFCNCNDCEKLPDYNPDDELIYLEERAKEFNRIKTAIDNCNSYFDKLNCLFTIKAGRIDLDRLQIWQNVPLDRHDPEWRRNYLDTTPQINLDPKTPDEIESHNLLIKEHLLHSISVQGQYTHPYDNFVVTHAKAAFEKKFIKAINPGQLIDEQIAKIEKHFNYPELSEYHKIFNGNNIGINQSSLFNFLAKGNDFDYSEGKLYVYHLSQIIHVEQILEFYKYLLNLRSQTLVTPTKDFSEDEIKMQTWEYHLRQFIDIATRWAISSIYSTVSKHHPYSSILGNYILTARIDYENFKLGLRNHLTANGINEAMRIDLEDRYTAMLNQYFEWYKQNEQNIIIFEPNNPYKVMLEFSKDTHKYIQNFFSKAEIRTESKPATDNQYHSLMDLFINPESYENCINALRSDRVQVIDNTNCYLLGERQKGSIVAWVEVLKMRGKIKQDIDRDTFAALLNKQFLGLNISDRTLSNVSTTSARKYFKLLTALIS